MKDNFQYTFTQFLSLLKVKVTSGSVVSYLETHPDEGTMLAYSDALNYFQIENVGIKVKPEDLTTIPAPFITYFQRNGGIFALVKSVTNGTIEWLDTKKNEWVKTQSEKFLLDWSGIILLAETNLNSGQKDYSTKRKQEMLGKLRVPAAILLLTAVFSGFILSPSQIAIATFVFLLLKIAGILLTTLLLIKSINNNNSLLNKLCNAGSSVNCQSILDSPAAMITPWLSWSDMGFIYFFGSFFSVLMSFGSSLLLNSYLTFQWVFSIVNIFFGIYSLYFQINRAKIFCPLCLGVVVIFILEFVMLILFSSNSSLKISLDVLSNLFIGFSIPVIFLLLFKNTALEAVESKKSKKELLKIKANPRIFEALMSGQKKMPEIPQDIPVIALGNPDARHTLTVVSNPLCTPCAHMHQRIEKLIEENGHIKCQIIFLSNTSEENEGGKFVRKLFSLPKHLHHRAVEEWYRRNDKNYDAWNKHYLNNPLNERSYYIQNIHNKWVNYAEIKGTPTLFMDEKLLLETISIEDLGSYLIHLNQEPIIT